MIQHQKHFANFRHLKFHRFGICLFFFSSVASFRIINSSSSSCRLKKNQQCGQLKLDSARHEPKGKQNTNLCLRHTHEQALKDAFKAIISQCKILYAPKSHRFIMNELSVWYTLELRSIQSS